MAHLWVEKNCIHQVCSQSTELDEYLWKMPLQLEDTEKSCGDLLIILAESNYQQFLSLCKEENTGIWTMISGGKRWELSGCREASQARNQLSFLKAGHGGVTFSCLIKQRSTSPPSWKVFIQQLTHWLPLIRRGLSHRNSTALLLIISGKLHSTDRWREGASWCKCMAVRGIPHLSRWRTCTDGWKHRNSHSGDSDYIPKGQGWLRHTGCHIATAYK